jgi:hypothetical protein
MRRLVVCLLIVGAAATPAAAQSPKPLPTVVFDARGFMTTLGQDPTTAADLQIAATALPGKAKGFILGASFYPLAGPGMAVGIGGEWVTGHGRKTTTDAAGTGVTAEQRLSSVSANLSLNFGARNGWSYVSAGMGSVGFQTFRGTTAPQTGPPRAMTLNAGGGARWFTSDHIAFSFDVRLYFTKAAAGTDQFPGRDKKRLMLLSAGISIR